jgi:hypothetical protein
VVPEPLLTDPDEDPERSAELADSVSMAALLLLERLSPLERAVFVLREVFGFGFPEIASAVGRSEAACRQLAVRARRHMDARAGPGSRPTKGSARNSPSDSSGQSRSVPGHFNSLSTAGGMTTATVGGDPASGLVVWHGISVTYS